MIGCAHGAPAYVAKLTGALGGSGDPGGFQRWSSSYSCNPSGYVEVSGSWWGDCPRGPSIGSGTTVTFANGNVVLDAGITMTGGALNFNTANAAAHLSTGCLP